MWFSAFLTKCHSRLSCPNSHFPNKAGFCVKMSNTSPFVSSPFVPSPQQYWFSASQVLKNVRLQGWWVASAQTNRLDFAAFQFPLKNSPVGTFLTKVSICSHSVHSNIQKSFELFLTCFRHFAHFVISSPKCPSSRKKTNFAQFSNKKMIHFYSTTIWSLNKPHQNLTAQHVWCLRYCKLTQISWWWIAVVEKLFKMSHLLLQKGTFSSLDSQSDTLLNHLPLSYNAYTVYQLRCKWNCNQVLTITGKVTKLYQNCAFSAHFSHLSWLGLVETVTSSNTLSNNTPILLAVLSSIGLSHIHRKRRVRQVSWALLFIINTSLSLHFIAKCVPKCSKMYLPRHIFASAVEI